ncbi:DUF4167 domain-containing protein, partial [Paenibacillus oleatilyticus]|uniref:DUF4167 domain-containing protein n=1 Tax=Paenibacillus oleatilyticus TaxID=2594886 RepID=UPI001C1F44AC|nr:DUF4167 domain-containing protein [Paenibacillus oleatilyticus]
MAACAVFCSCHRDRPVFSQVSVGRVQSSAPLAQASQKRVDRGSIGSAQDQGALPLSQGATTRLDYRTRMRPSKSRSRSKSNRSRSMGNIVNRVFDSSGPEGKVRGTPQQIIDKYN